MPVVNTKIGSQQITGKHLQYIALAHLPFIVVKARETLVTKAGKCIHWVESSDFLRHALVVDVRLDVGFNICAEESKVSCFVMSAQLPIVSAHAFVICSRGSQKGMGNGYLFPNTLLYIQPQANTVFFLCDPFAIHIHLVQVRPTSPERTCW